MIELAEPREQAVLVGAPTRGVTREQAGEHLDELARLAHTAGADIAGTVIQRLDAPHPRFYLGAGKVDALRRQIHASGGTLIVFDEELSPAQGKNLEDFTGTRVVDRAELILDIFASRARTAEARMQVELAQLQYLLPRLTRMWVHLSRVRGGIGMRGPGETQLETDRRIINRKIARLKRELERVERGRETRRKGRSGEFRATLVGYTNAGKSSILRALSGSDLFVEDRLFATLDAATRTVELDGGHHALVTDTVGFIRKLPHHLVASFRGTLAEVAGADLILHVLDVSHPGWEERARVVDEAIAGLGLDGVATALVCNKVDRLTHQEEGDLARRLEVAADLPALFVSTVEAGALEPLRRFLLERVLERHGEVDVTLPATDGAALAELYRLGEVVGREEEGDEIRLRMRLPEPALGRLRRRAGLRVTEAA